MKPKSSIARSMLARLSIGLVLGIVLGVVLHQSNTRSPSLYADLVSQGAFGAPGSEVATTSASQACNGLGDNCGDGSGCCVGYTCDANTDTCVEDFYVCACGGCVSSGGGEPGQWGGPFPNDNTCGGTCGDTNSWPPECCSPVDDLNATACCIDAGPPYSQACCDYNPSWCSSSSAAPQYCCAFDGTGCIAAPDNDPGNDACDQNHTGYASDTCDEACAPKYCCAFDGSGCIAAPDNDPANDACDQNFTGYTTDTCDEACVPQQWCCQHVLPAGPANCSAL